MNKNKRIRRLEILNKSARDGLIREKIRGHLILWKNNFKTLERIIQNEDEYKDEEELFPTLLGSVVNDCLTFQISHIYETDTIAENLIQIEEDLSRHIFDTVADMGHDAEDICDAMLFLAAHESLFYITDFIDDRIRLIEGK